MFEYDPLDNYLALVAAVAEGQDVDPTDAALCIERAGMTVERFRGHVECERNRVAQPA